ncbi:MAG: hypothetical protein KatS3mg114_0731 [Planctomycetaceae bacterium]|nr:MAG: hypothetical protein KatS3mg114_0731 [Planctomycetaceae bacterium]
MRQPSADALGVSSADHAAWVWSVDEEKLAALAQFAAGAGHEINNPLAVIIGRAQQLLRHEADLSKRQLLLSIIGQAYRIRDMIGDVMLFARPPQPACQPLSFDRVLGYVLHSLQPEFEQHRVAVTLQPALQSEETPPSSLSPPLPKVWADQTQLAIVLQELLRNALQACAHHGQHIHITREWAAQALQCDIHDDGRGFSEEERRHAFDPFYSGRQAGRGLGFGLCKVARIVQMHQAQIEIQSQPGGPTTVRLRWPYAPPTIDTPSAGSADERSGQGG